MTARPTPAALEDGLGVGSRPNAGSNGPSSESPPGSGAVSFREAATAWGRIAVHSFGGPAGQIAVIHRVVVEEKSWLTERSFLHALGYCMLLPGPEAQQLVTYVGWKLHGMRGGLAAGGLFILPGFISILALSLVYMRYGQSPIVEGIFYGVKPAVITIVVQALLRLRRRTVQGPLAMALAVAAFLDMFVFAVPFPIVVLAAALAGLVGFASASAVSGGTAADRAPEVPAAWRRSAVVTAASWLAIWLIPVAALALSLGTDHVLVDEATFFSRAAVVTFGGAYAVLTYVAEQATEVYAWLTPREMLDGLGLAESTPGPLIQVVQFVGFVGAYRNPGDVHPLVMGILGAVVTTWVTFAPCFLFIFAGAPFVESLQNRPRLQGALSGITAAVLGVVANLALWFAVHTIFRDTRTLSSGPLSLDAPVWSSFDPGAALICAVTATFALKYGGGMFAVLGIGVALGLVLYVVPF